MGPEMEQKWTRNGAEMGPKWSRNGPQNGPKMVATANATPGTRSPQKGMKTLCYSNISAKMIRNGALPAPPPAAGSQDSFEKQS